MWGLVLSLFATTTNFGGAVTIRLFLGIFEAAVTPGFALFTSQVRTFRGAAVDRHVLTSASGIPSQSKGFARESGFVSMDL